MKVRELVAALAGMPQDAEVLHIWDGYPRTAIELVWATEDGRVMTADCGMVVYDLLDRPAGSPTDKYWDTPSQPEEMSNAK